MEDQPEEVLRFMDAVKALRTIEDDAACARAISNALKYWGDNSGTLREIRQERVQRLRDQGMTWQEIGDVMGVHFTRAQQIAKGFRGSKRPKKEAEEKSAE
ncbi:hypothetical protein OG471_14865 [Streptomyces sp. NBC_01336]|uniref:hypothetical protein n=1 Tax=Streptomyces sp. NBC_01336 TaxID=2903829 RepID=UPI002E16553A|nr:hypothetical protein OG471_14865 [Streptomyces sp. NBC_01336]